MTRRYDVTNRARRTSRATGTRGWYDSPEWRARSRAWFRTNPICVGFPAKATICDPDPPVIAMLCCAGRSGRCAGRATAEFQAILDQCSAPWWDPDHLWDRAKDQTAEVFIDHHPGAAHVLLGQAA